MTLVSESANSPWANPTCSDPDAPADVRSERRWRTAMFDTPQARDSFQLDCNQRATPRLARMAHASSMTTTTPFPPGTEFDRWWDSADASSPARGTGGTTVATAAWNQAVAQVMRTPRAAE